MWLATPIDTDGRGQRLNGVLNVGYTVDVAHPVWAPIDRALFGKAEQRTLKADERDVLARQILDVIYTVRNNLFHGGKRADDANDREVLERALPLLVMVVGSFLPIRKAA